MIHFKDNRVMMENCGIKKYSQEDMSLNKLTQIYWVKIQKTKQKKDNEKKNHSCLKQKLSMDIFILLAQL